MFVEPEKDYEGYLFDCDGTLIDSMPMHYRGWVDALEEVNAEYTLLKEDYKQMAGMALHQVVHRLNEKYNGTVCPDRLLAIKKKLYLQRIPQIPVIEPVVHFLKKITSQGKPAAVVSGGQKDMVVASLEATRLLDYFKVIVTHEDVAHGKPAPDMFLLAAEQIGVSPAHCLVLEDGETGIIGAQAAGMDVAFVDSLKYVVQE